jgi:hypothetical protein
MAAVTVGRVGAPTRRVAPMVISPALPAGVLRPSGARLRRGAARCAYRRAT